MKNSNNNNSNSETFGYVIVLTILMLLASTAGVLASNETMVLYGECDEFYIEYEHGAHTLSSENADYNIVDRQSFDACMKAYEILKNHTCEVSANKSWEYYEHILSTTLVDTIVQSIYISQDIAHIITITDTSGISTYNLELESIGHLISSTSLQRIISIIERISHVAIYNEWEQVPIKDNTYKWLFMKELYQLQFMDLVNEG